MLQDGTLFGLPVVLDTRDPDIVPGDKVLLQYQGQDLATVEISSRWEPNKPLEAQQCYGTTSIEHPAVAMITGERGKYYLGAPLGQHAACHTQLPNLTTLAVMTLQLQGSRQISLRCKPHVAPHIGELSAAPSCL